MLRPARQVVCGLSVSGHAQGLYLFVRLRTIPSDETRPSQASGVKLEPDGPATLRATTCSSSWGVRSRPSGDVPSSSPDESDSGSTRCSCTLLTTDVLRTFGGLSGLAAGLRLADEEDEAEGRDDDEDDVVEGFGRDLAGAAALTTVVLTTTGFLGWTGWGLARTESGPPTTGFLVKRLIEAG